MATKEEIAARLRAVRAAAGHETAAAAARAHHWVGSTYSGHENATRGIKPPDRAKYAQAFGVTEEWLMFGKADDAPAAAARAPAPRGFSESTVAPFHARSDSERRAILAIADHCSPRSRHPSIYKATRHVPGLAIMEGDLIILDLNPSPRDGQIVIVQVETDSGEYNTRAALCCHGNLIAPFGEDVFAADKEVSAMGSLLCILRWPARL